MPLMKRKSQKAFEHNIEAEMHAGKPQKQALAIAYSVKRKAKKAEGGPVPEPSPTPDAATQKARKMLAPVKKYVDTHTDGGPGYAEGGSISASKEKRPMPDDLYDDAKMEHRNSSKHAPMRGDDAKTQDDTSYQAKKGLKTTKIKHPRMVKSDVVQARLRDEEDDLMTMEPIHTMEPHTEGHDVRDMEDEHSTHRKPYAKGGEIKDDWKHTGSLALHKTHGQIYRNLMGDYEAKDRANNTTFHSDLQSAKAHLERQSQNKPKLARGGEIEESDHAHGLDGHYEDDLQDLPPSEDEGAGMARSDNEEGPDRQGPDSEDLDLKMMAEGGRSDANDYDEEEIEHAASLAAAIMMKRKKMAMGGEVSLDSTDDDQADLTRNAEEDMNLEDQASFNAMRKENYSDSEGLEQMDSPEDSNEHEPEHEEMDPHDKSLVGQIRSKMKKRSAMTR